MGCRDKFTSPDVAGKAAGRLSALWDRARDLKARAGIRPYTVTIVRCRYAGARQRGDGPYEVVASYPVLPTPKVETLAAVAERVDADQLREDGSIVISEISLSYSEDAMHGRGPDGSPVPKDERVFWEVVYLDPKGRPTDRQRYIPSSAPYANYESAEWVVTLTRAPDDRGRDGRVR